MCICTCMNFVAHFIDVRLLSCYDLKLVVGKCGKRTLRKAENGKKVIFSKAESGKTNRTHELMLLLCSCFTSKVNI